MMLPMQNNSTYLLHGWDLTDQKGLLGALLCTLGLSLIHETLSAFINLAENINVARYLLEGRSYPVTFQHCVLAFLHIFRVYICCLLVMSLFTWNTWIVLTLGLGSGVGYLMIRPLILCLLHKQRRTFTLTSNHTTDDNSTTGEPLCSTPNTDIDTSTSISKDLLSETIESTDLTLQWDYMTVDLEPNIWIPQSNWDGSTEMLDTGCVGRNSPEHSTVSCTMYMSVV